MDKYKPTEEELKLINDKFAKEPYKSADDLYVFPAMIVDNELTAYFTRLHPDFLNQCVKDCNEGGVVLLLGHDKTKLPTGKAFKGISVSTGELTEIFAKCFMQKNLNVSGINTDDLMKAYLGGTTEDVSIGFAAKTFECNLCGKDIRSMDCPHLPGHKYNDKAEEDEKGELCFAWVKDPAGPKGEALLEISIVYKGAVTAAKQKKPSETPEFTINLADGKKLKEMPMEAPIAMNFSAPLNDEYGRGEGRGKGGPRQGDGGAKYCKCPKCGYTIDHERGKPCQEISCAKCGTKMEGTNKKNSMELLDCSKLMTGGYKEKELKDFELSSDNIDTILAQELSEENVKKLKDLAIANKEDLGVLLKEFPAYEILNTEKDYARWTRAYINSLPNASFAVIEPAYSKGETDNKNARHLPHHNEKGGGTLNQNLDLSHLRNALARMNQIKPVTDSISIEDLRGKASTHLEHHKSALDNERQANEINSLMTQLETANTNNNVAVDKIAKLEQEKIDLLAKVKSTEEANLQLQIDKKELEPKAKEGEKYRNDLINEILELGIKLNGNSFDSVAYKKTLENMAIEDIKETKALFWTQLCDKLPEVRNTLGPKAILSDSKQYDVPDKAFKVS